MNNIKKLFSYLGFNDTTIDENQLLGLSYILFKEQNPDTTRFDYYNMLVNTVIDKLETNGFKNISEQEIIENL